jgi:hypothetical protein
VWSGFYWRLPPKIYCTCRAEPFLRRLDIQPILIVMVAYNSRWSPDEGLALSPDVAAQLRSSLERRWNKPEAYDIELSAALAAAAEDARVRGLRPEELLLALKAIEQDVALSLDAADTQDRDRFRIWLVGACMRAFFAVEPPSES